MGVKRLELFDAGYQHLLDNCGRLYYDTFSMVLCKSRMHTIYKDCFPGFLICFLVVG